MDVCFEEYILAHDKKKTMNIFFSRYFMADFYQSDGTDEYDKKDI